MFQKLPLKQALAARPIFLNVFKKDMANMPIRKRERQYR
jgi:hypothetical protein